MVPCINREWHPFTIASANTEQNMSFYIKRLGDWTVQLHSLFKLKEVRDGTDLLKFFIRGPFGAPTQEVTRYQRVILVSGGIGATPFVSICKQLHYQHIKCNKPITSTEIPPICNVSCDKRIDKRNQEIQLEGNYFADYTEERIQDALAERYGVNFKVHFQEKELNAENEMIFQKVAHMMRMSKLSSIRGSNSSPCKPKSFMGGGNWEEENAGKDSTQIEKLSYKNPIQNSNKGGEKDPVSISQSNVDESHEMLGFGNFRYNLISTLHSSKICFFMACLCIGRMAAVISGSIFESDFIKLKYVPLVNGGEVMGSWVALSYALISLPLALILTITIIVEVSLIGGRVLKEARRILEIVMFGPVTLSMTVLEFRRFINNEPSSALFIFLQYVFTQTIIFILILYRMFRAIGKKGLIDETKSGEVKCHPRLGCTKDMDGLSSLPNLDFVWTTPSIKEDSWICRELTPVLLGNSIHLHRYVTRGSNCDKEVSEYNFEDPENGLFEVIQQVTKTGRPNWEKLIGKIARNTVSDGVVGIFFCGPPTMGKIVRGTARKIELWSDLRDAYLKTTDVRTLMHDLRLSHEDLVLRLRENGCRVRLIYHEENFS